MYFQENLDMNRLTIRKNPDHEKISIQRGKAYLELSPQERWKALIGLIELNMAIAGRNNRKPNKITLTKGGIIYNESV